MTAAAKEYKLNEDDMYEAKLPIANLPNPLFKHLPMKMTYRHLIEPRLPVMYQNKARIRRERKQTDKPMEEAAAELRYRQKRAVLEDYLKRVEKLDLLEHPKVERALWEKGVKLMQLVEDVEKEIKEEMVKQQAQAQLDLIEQEIQSEPEPEAEEAKKRDKKRDKKAKKKAKKLAKEKRKKRLDMSSNKSSKADSNAPAPEPTAAPAVDSTPENPE